MQEAVPVGTGAMAAILGLDAAAVIAGCAQAQATFGAGSAEVVEAVNFNDPGQTVIAGSKAAVDKACEMLKAGGAKRALPLPVSAPFHSSLMKPAAERLKQALAETTLASAQLPVINNIDVSVASDANAIRDALYRQAFGPVRWVECVKAMQARGATLLVECGPGKVLAGMAKRIDPALTGVSLYDPASLAEVQALLAV
jgi:[acyl-carrier-protein] S-malonyltransferase